MERGFSTLGFQAHRVTPSVEAPGQFSLNFDAEGRLVRARAALSLMRLTEEATRVFELSTPGTAGEEDEQFERFFRCP